MNLLFFIYNELLWRPLFNGLIWLYATLPVKDIGIAIILLTIAIRLVLSPLLLRARKAQQDLAKIQPELKAIQGRFKGKPEEQARALKEFYALHKVNPFSGCLIMLVQLPILLALFKVFQQGFETEMLVYLYPWVSNPGTISPLWFGFFDLSKGNMYFGVIAAAVQYLQMRFTITPPVAPASATKFDLTRMMQYQIPFVVFIASYTLPSSLALYWTAANLFDIVQEIILRKAKSREVETTRQEHTHA